MAIPRLPGWQQAILKGVGAPATPENLKFLNAWAQAEGGNASNNPFNTTQGAAGATAYNSNNGDPVKNYLSPQQGIAATIQTLNNGRYGAIIGALRKGTSAMADAQAEATTPWGTGSLIEKVLGGPVTGGVPTSGNPSSALAQATMSGFLPNGMGQSPTPQQDLIGYVLASNQAIQQRAQAQQAPFQNFTY